MESSNSSSSSGVSSNASSSLRSTHRYSRTFSQGFTLDHDFSIDDGAGSDLHTWHPTPPHLRLKKPSSRRRDKTDELARDSAEVDADHAREQRVQREIEKLTDAIAQMGLS